HQSRNVPNLRRQLALALQKDRSRVRPSTRETARMSPAPLALVQCHAIPRWARTSGAGFGLIDQMTTQEQRGDDTGAAGVTVSEFSRRYRVGEDKVRGWIDRGELRAINTATALCGRPRWVIPPEALMEFEQRRRGGPAEKPK